MTISRVILFQESQKSGSYCPQNIAEGFKRALKIFFLYDTLRHLPFSTDSVPNLVSSEALNADSFPGSRGGLGSCVALVRSCHFAC